MAACIATPRCSAQSSCLLSHPSRSSLNITRSRGRISMSMQASNSNDSNDLILPEQKLVLPESQPDALPTLASRLNAKMQSGFHFQGYQGYQGQRVRGTVPRYPRRSPPPDIPSMIMDKFIVYIGMPLVSLVTELIIAQMMYMEAVDPNEPIKFYINSTGTSRADGETVALENEGFAIYDAMMAVKNEIHTYCIGAAVGQACLLLAAGKKGRRYMMVHSTARLEEPRLPGTGQIQADDLKIKVDKVVRDRDTTVKILAKHTGNSEETILRAMMYPKNMKPRTAIEFGLADKILWKGKGDEREAVSLKEWDKREGIEVVRPYGEMEEVSS